MAGDVAVDVRDEARADEQAAVVDRPDVGVDAEGVLERVEFGAVVRG